MRKLVFLVVALAVAVPTATMAFHPNDDCDACHLPHNDVTLDGMPLWSGVITTVQSWTNYDSDTLDATDVGDPYGATLVCLACHDGVSGSHAISDGLGDLTGTHPMHFTYDSQLATDDGELVDPDSAGSSTLTGSDGTITADLLNPDKKVNCQSCHEIHINGLHEADAGTFLGEDVPHLVPIPGIEFSLGWMGDPTDLSDWELSYGILCRTCHIK